MDARLDPNAKYAVLKGAKGERAAELTGRELGEDGFEAILPERCDGELYEVRRCDPPPPTAR